MHRTPTRAGSAYILTSYSGLGLSSALKNSSQGEFEGLTDRVSRPKRSVLDASLSWLETSKRLSLNPRKEVREEVSVNVGAWLLLFIH